MEFSYQIPLIDGSHLELALKTGSSAVFVGANGSGKSRLGTFLELQSGYTDRTHRIAVQRALQIPNFVQMGDSESARRQLLFGHERATNKQGLRWHNKPTTYLLNDYQSLLVALFSQEFEILTGNKEEREATPEAVPQSSHLDALRSIWNDVITTRRIKIRGASLVVYDPQQNVEYAGDEMSDGERVMFYLIGQCLMAPHNGVLIVDEPELHIHKAVLISLWDKIELCRADCLFIYFTHDIEFAISRTFEQRFVVRYFDGQRWDIVAVPFDRDVPDDLLTRILGSRKPILFVEGEGDSKDVSVFGKVYDRFNVTPVGSCEHVIHMTNSFNLRKHLHRLECFGLIDRDGRADDEVEMLREQGVWTLEFAEIENVLLHETILSQVAELLAFPPHEAERIVSDVRDHVIGLTKHDIDRTAVQFAKRRLASALRVLGLRSNTFEDLENEYRAGLGRCDPRRMYEDRRMEIEQAIEAADYGALLRLYDNKGMVKQIGGFFRLKSNEYPDFVLRHLSGKEGAQLSANLRALLPDLHAELDRRAAAYRTA